MLLALSMLLLGPVAQAGCPSTPLELQQLIDQALLSYESWEWEAFAHARDAVDSAAICAADPLDALAASRVHLIHALAAGVNKDEGAATAHFRSLLATDPSFVLPDSLAAPGSLLQRAFEAARTAEPGETDRVHATELWVDGERARRVPVDRPFVAQASGEMGLQTWLVSAQPLPDDLQLALGAPVPTRAPLFLGVGGGAALILGGAALFLASRTSAELDGAPTLAAGDALLIANHRYVGAGAGLGAIGLGLGATALTFELRAPHRKAPTAEPQEPVTEQPTADEPAAPAPADQETPR